MRNLKKILALVLALVMSMSLVTIANAADFTDNDDISYEEAADVMNAIGIIEGFEDGSFDPDGTLTREQAATLVTRMLLGDNADRLGIESSTFDDVAVTRWSAPYIEYCASLGLIDGAGDGNFYPAGQLTGYAFAKILLTALGYSSEKEGLTGPSWSVNVAALAMEVGLHDGLENGISAAVLTREEAAQMALNAICAPLVAYDNNATVIVNGAEVSIGSGDAYYVTTTLAREQRISTQTLSNTGAYNVEFGERYFPNLRLIREADEFERPSHTWVYEGEEIGSYIDYDLRVADYTEAITGRDLYDLLGKSTIQDYDIAYYVDGVANDNIKASNMIRTNSVSYAETGNGVLTEVFVDHTNEEVTITSVNTYLAKANADYNETRGELSLTVYQSNATGTGKTVDVEDIDSITGYQEGDFMLVNMAAVGTTGDKMEVVRINDVDSMVDCTVTSYSKGKTVTVDGEDYDYAEKAFYDDDVLDEYNQGYLDDYTYTFYFDQYGYVIGADIYEGEANYVFITGYDINGSNLAISNATAGAIFLDGTFEEIQVNISNTNKNIRSYNSGKTYDRQYGELNYGGGTTGRQNGDSEYNKWFRYTTNSNGVYTLTPAEYWVEEEATTAGDEVNSATIRVGEGTTRAYGNDDSVYITVDTGAVDYTTQMGITKVNGTYTGVQSVDLKVFSKDENALDSDISIFALYSNNTNGRYIIGAVIVGEDMNNTKNYAYILDSDAQREYTEGGDTFWDVEAVVDGEIVTLTVADYDGAINTIKSYIAGENGAMCRVTYNADGHVIEAEECVDKAFENKLNDYVYGSHTWNSTTEGKGTDYIDRDIEPDYDKIYNVDVTTDQALFIGGNTLYIGTALDYGLALANAPIIVVQDVVDQAGNHVKLSHEVYSSVSQALDTLKDKNAFEGNISAVLNDNGTAAYLVINSDDPVSITTDDGSTDYETGDYYSASVYNMNGWGMVSLTAYRPGFAGDSGTVAVSYDIYAGNRLVARRTASMATTDSTVTDTWSGLVGDPNAVIEVRNFTITPQYIKVRYLDAAGNDISARLAGEGTAYPEVALGSTSTWNVGLGNGYKAGTTYNWSVKGATTSLSGTGVTLGNAVTISITPTGKDYVTITYTGMTAIELTYTLAGFGATALSDAPWNITGEDDTIAVTPATSSAAAGTPVVFKVAFDQNATVVNPAYHIVIKKLGVDMVVTGDDSDDFVVNMPAANFAITKADVEITPIAAPKVISAEVVTENNSSTIVVEFNNAMDTSTVTKSAVTEGASPNAFNGSVDIGSFSWSNGNKTLTIQLVNGVLNVSSAQVSLANTIVDVNGVALASTTLTITPTGVTVAP